MFLKRIELVGFKSFADKTVLVLDEGMTAVVGPNGCGKSNVVEAVRWVLGEQRPTALRTKAMGDVIFSGSSATGPVSMAQVSLILDNAQRRLALDAEEVTISRCLYRNGESRYLLNKRSCMLRDVKDILYNSGLGAPEYAIMQREMIDVLLANRANERRLLIEEAAGIMKYRANIKQALSRLRTSEATITRLEDIVEERARHVRLLKSEASKARRLKKYREQLTVVRRQIAGGSLQSLRKESEPLRQERRQIERSLHRVSASLTSLLSREEVKKLEIQEVELRINETRSKLAQAREEASAAEKAVQIVDVESRERAKERTVLCEELATAQRRREQSSRLHAEGKRAADAFQQKITELEEAHTRQAQIVALSARDVEDRRQRAVTAREERASAAQAFRSTELELEKLDVEFEYGSRVVQQLAERAERAQKRKLRAQEQIQEFQGRHKSIRGELPDLRSTEERLRSRHERARRLVNRAQERLKNVSVSRGDLAGRREVLLHLQTSREGFTEGARFLMRANHLGIVALLGEELTTSSGYERAVEAALSDAVDFVIVERRDTARTLIDLLRSSSAGRAKIVEYSLLVSRDGVPTSSVSRDEFPQVHGPILEIVEAPARIQPLLRVLLGRTLLLENLPSDTDVSRLWDKGWEQLVTLEGDVFRADGIHQGGSSREVDLLGRTRQIHDVQRRLTRTERAEHILASRTARLREAAERYAGELASCSSRALELLHSLDSIDATLKSAERELAEADEILSAVERQSRKEQRTTQDAATARQKLARELTRRKQESERTARSVEEAENELLGSISNLQKMETELQRIAEEQKRVESEAASAQSEVVRRTSELEYADQRIPELTDRIAALDRATRASAVEEQALAERRNAAHAEDSRLEQEIDTHFNYREVLEAELEEIAKEVGGLRGELDQLNATNHRFEIDIARLETKEDDLLSRVLSELGMKEADLLGMEVSKSLEELEEELDLLQTRVFRLGEVNPKADDEYQTESESLTELERELSDVTQSRDELLRSIDKANRAAKDRFTRTWEQVNLHFGETFSTLFPGGTARLELVGEGSVLSRDVEMVVRPPEKRKRPVEQLSGGERALTALAFLFALYKEKAGPVCILDEVDAPLDDPNTSRFVDMLNTFSSRIQFFIITHNKHTMSRASKLLGITMENGVSRLVPVKLKGRRLEH